MTWYLTLRPPPHRAAPIPTQPVLDYLTAQPELRRADPHQFESVHGQPWVRVIVAATLLGGGYHYFAEAPAPERIDIVELICGDDAPAHWYEALACRIAAHLDWTAVEEGEDRRLWPR